MSRLLLLLFLLQARNPRSWDSEKRTKSVGLNADQPTKKISISLKKIQQPNQKNSLIKINHTGNRNTQACIHSSTKVLQSKNERKNVATAFHIKKDDNDLLLLLLHPAQMVVVAEREKEKERQKENNCCNPNLSGFHGWLEEQQETFSSDFPSWMNPKDVEVKRRGGCSNRNPNFRTLSRVPDPASSTDARWVNGQWSLRRERERDERGGGSNAARSLPYPFAPNA
jgi:hypothetical protein